MKNNAIFKLPPRQTGTTKFPVVGEQKPSAALHLDTWRLQVEGEVAFPQNYGYDEILAWPQQDVTFDIHCVTSWSRFDSTFTGIPLQAVLDRAKPNPRAQFVRFVAYSGRNHDTSLPLDFARENCWLVHSFAGKPLAPEHGYPLRVVTLKKYFYKSLKWVGKIILLAEDTLGYWERASAYHNHADPWQEERYDLRKLATKEQTKEFRDCDNFDVWRRSSAEGVLIKANLSNWQPRTKDLHGLQLKCCSFRNANLANVDFRGANLTLGKFWGADLTNVDFTGADLEGADFSGANLSGAKLVDVALSAAKFFRVNNKGQQIAANVEKMQIGNASGLLEDQENFLRDRGVIG